MMITTQKPTGQPPCPLENTKSEQYCMNAPSDPKFRPSGPCEHSAVCYGIKAKFEMYDNENRWQNKHDK